MAAAVLGSVARKMSRAAAPSTPLVGRGLHAAARSGSGSSSGPANSNQVQDLQQAGTADIAAAASRLGSRAGRLTSKIPQPPPYRRLVHGRGIHSGSSPDPATPPKVLHTTTALDKATTGVAYTVLDKATTGVAYAALFALSGAAIYLHFWVKPALEELTTMCHDFSTGISHLRASFVSHPTPTTLASAGHGNTKGKGTGVIDKLGGQAAFKTMLSQENRVKELEATIMDLKAEIAELKVASYPAPSQGKA